MKTLINLKKQIFLPLIAIAMIAGGAFLFQLTKDSNARAANPGDVIITEFATNPGACMSYGDGPEEWFELTNTTMSPIDLTGWGIMRQSLGTPEPISGTIPAMGILVFSVPCVPGSYTPPSPTGNDDGDIIVLNDGTQPIFAVSYGVATDPMAQMHSDAPGAGESALMSGPGWIVSGTGGIDTSKGWFNAIPGGFDPESEDPLEFGPPTQGELSDYIEYMVEEAMLPDVVAVNTNFAGLDNPSASEGLYFEIEDLGKLTFNGTINLTDDEVFQSLFDIGDALIMAQEGDSQIIGLDSTVADALANAGATLEMYGLNDLGFSDAIPPNLKVLDDQGQEIPYGDPNHPDLGNITYDEEEGNPGQGILTFDASHFTQFETEMVRYVDVSNSGFEDGSPESPYSTIQEAIDTTSDGWLIVVANGTYEENPYIDKSISLIGGETSSIEGVTVGEVLWIDAVDVVVEDFSIYGDYPIYLDEDSSATINGCNLIGFTAVSANTGSSVTVRDSKLIGNTNSGYGIESFGIADAQENWWGDASMSHVEFMVSGNVDFEPWYLDEEMTILSSSDTTGPTVSLSNDINGVSYASGEDVVRIIADILDENGLDEAISPTISIGDVLIDEPMTQGEVQDQWYYDWTVASEEVGTNLGISVSAKDIVGNNAQGATGINAYTVLDNDQVGGSGTVNLDGDDSEVIITDDVVVNIPSDVTGTVIDVSQFLTGVTGTLPSIIMNSNTSVGSVEVVIPDGAEISADDPGWTGSINPPTVQSNDSVTVVPESGGAASVTSVIEVGFSDTLLTFDKGVRLLIAGQAGKYAGYSRGGIFTQITNNCANDSQATGDALPAEGDCKIGVAGDLVIWTKHFTSFVTYTTGSPATYAPTPQTQEQPAEEVAETPVEDIAEAPVPELISEPVPELYAEQLIASNYDYELVGQSPYPSTLNPGDIINVWIDIKNTGSVDWNDNVRLGSGSEFGAINQKRDYDSEFANDNWRSKNRPVNLSSIPVRVGETGRFQFKIKAPSSLGTYKAYFTPVADGVDWMKDIGVYWEIKVNGGGEKIGNVFNNMFAINTHTVKVGDTLCSIAMSAYGHCDQWYKLVEKNGKSYPSLWSNPEKIGVGWKLKY